MGAIQRSSAKGSVWMRKLYRNGREAMNDWTWKKLAEHEPKHSRGDIQPDIIINPQGNTVRHHCDYKRTPALDRFTELIKKIQINDDECWQWLGGDTFRVDDDRVTTPQRFIYEEMTGEKLADQEKLVKTCRTPWCCRPAHRNRVSRGRNSLPFAA